MIPFVSVLIVTSVSSVIKSDVGPYTCISVSDETPCIVRMRLLFNRGIETLCACLDVLSCGYVKYIF